MDNSRAPSYEEDPWYYDDSRVVFINELIARGDSATLQSCRKPSLSEYDEDVLH